MKKSVALLVWILVLICLAVPVVLAEDSIFKDKIISGHSVDVDDDYNFIITLNKYGNKIFVNGGDIFQSIPLGDCKKLGEIYRVCFYNITYDVEEDEVYAKVEIFRQSPDLTVTKDINETKLHIGQEAQVTITIKNTGDNVEKATMIDDYPKEIKIVDLEGPGCFVHENSVSWSGHLDTDEEKTCIFNIYATSEVHKELTARLRYWTGLKWETKYSGSEKIDIEPVIDMKIAVVREDYEVDDRELDFEDETPSIYVGENPRLIINLTSNYDEDVDIDSLKITLPEGVDYLQTTYLRLNYKNSSGAKVSDVWNSQRITRTSPKVLKWSGTLTNNKTKTWVLKLDTKKSGSQNIITELNYTLDYDHGESSYSELKSTQFSIVEPGLAFHITVDDEAKLFSIPKRLDDEDNTIDIQSAHPYRFTVYAQNLNAFDDLKDLEFFTVGELADFGKKRYAEVQEEAQVIPWGLELYPPEIYADKTYKVNFSVRYSNEFGERFFNTTEFEFTVKAFEPIEIDHDIEEGETLESKEKTMVAVTLDNQRVAEIKNVYVKDIIPKEFEVIGITSNKLKLVADDKSEVYKYEIIPPVVTETEHFNLTTVVHYFDDKLNREFFYNYTTDIMVIPREPDVNVELTLDEPENIYPGNLIPATIKITNQDAKELIRDITLHMPFSRELDLVGPKTFFVDRIEPDESVELKNMFWFRPKVAKEELDIGLIDVEFHDQYGSVFHENVTDEKIEVKKGLISGPVIVMTTVVPEVLNISESYDVLVQADNLGNEKAKVTINMGDKEWTADIRPRSKEVFKYPIKYTTSGNYTIPGTEALLDYHGRDLYTGSEEKNVEVKLLLPKTPMPKAVVEKLPTIQAAPEGQPGTEANMTSIEETLVEESKKQEQASNYTFYGIIGLVVLLIIVGYIFYRRGKKEGEAPFLQ